MGIISKTSEIVSDFLDKANERKIKRMKTKQGYKTKRAEIRHKTRRTDKVGKTIRSVARTASAYGMKAVDADKEARKAMYEAAKDGAINTWNSAINQNSESAEGTGAASSGQTGFKVIGNE